MLCRSLALPADRDPNICGAGKRPANRIDLAMMIKQHYSDYEIFRDEYAVEVPEDFNFTFDVIDRIAAEEPDRRAMIHLDPDGATREYSFTWFAEQSARLASALKAQGLKKGDRVMLILYRRVEFWVSMLALHRIGAIAIPATAQLTAKDIVFRAVHGRLAGVIAEDTLLERIELARREYDGWQHFIVVSSVLQFGDVSSDAMYTAPYDTKPLPEGWVDFDDLIHLGVPVMPKPARPELAAGNDPMIIFFSSGTTGMPKMVQHGHTYPLGHFMTAAYWHDLEPDDVHLTLADSGWSKSSWGKLYGQWIQRCTVFAWDFRGKFQPSELLRVLETHAITTFCAPPTVYRFMILEDFRAYDLSSLRHCSTAGELLNHSVFEDWKAATGLPIYEGFGQTETTVALATFPHMTPKPGSVGRPAPGYDVILLNSDNQICACGEEGEICMRFPKGQPPIGLFQGYADDPALTAKVLTDELYRTGDKAYMDDDGYFWFLGRIDDLIKSSGYRIGPFEVESALVSHPAVVEAAVVGVPDPIRGQAVKATVVLDQGFIPSDELTRELQNHVKKITAPYKYPRIIEYVKELPKTLSGKIRRAELRARHQTEAAPEKGGECR